MKFTCYDYFMIRTPALPFKYLKAYKEQKEDIYEFIHSNQYLDNFFKKALLISSKSIYSSYINIPSDKKKYENLKKSLLKYFIRSTTRPTPYGYFASVSMGSFSDETRIIKEDEIIDIKADNSWINSVINMLESDINVLQKLKLKINKLCYRSGDRFKNPYFTNYGKVDGAISKKEKFIQENNIRYTSLIEFIKNSAAEFILYSDLEKKIIDKYPGVPKELVDKTINELCQNEYLLTNLRIPAYCNDVLEYVIDVLESINYKGKYIEQLKAIQSMMLEYKSHQDIKIIEKIYSLMGQIHKNKDYLALNVGNRMEEKFLCQKLKTKLENLVDFLADIPVEFDTLQKFRMKFIEEYGTNVEVPIFKIIDSNDFNGLSLINKENNIISEREEIIRKVFDEKIFQSILNGEDEVNFTKNDFKNVFKYNSEYWKTYDLTVMIMKQDKDYKLYLGPAKSSLKAGAMFQRFAGCFDQNDFKRYNKIYKKQDFFSDEYLFVEVREMSISGQYNNVINNTKNYKYFLCFGNCEEKLEEIDLKDIYIGMTNDEKLYLKSKKYNKKIKIICDNMLNPNLNNRIIQLLKYISESTECFPEIRLHILGNNKYKYCPRINIEGIIVSPKRWFLDEEDLESNNYEEFSKKLKKSKNMYGINDIVYQCINDNRVIIDMNKEEYVDLLYSEYRKSKRLDFNEIEKELFNGAIIRDNNDNLYINEFVFSITGKNIKKNININDLPKNIVLQQKNKKFLLFQDGWIYFKLYGMEKRTNELLSEHFPQLLNELYNPEHFFIRYIDEQGSHLRIRVKCKNETEAIKKIIIINNWIKEMMEKKIVCKILFDVYQRETNRYGGDEIIGYCEKVFFKDSIFVEKLLGKYDLTNENELEKIYIFGIVNIIKYLTKNVEEMFLCLDTIKFDGIYRKLYRSKSKEYINLVDEILEEKSEEYKELLEEYKEEKEVLINFRCEMDKQIKKNKNTNYKEAIIFSIVHMYCNRLTGDRTYEEKYLEIVRNSMYHIVNRNKNKNINKN